MRWKSYFNSGDPMGPWIGNTLGSVFAAERLPKGCMPFPFELRARCSDGTLSVYQVCFGENSCYVLLLVYKSLATVCGVCVLIFLATSLQVFSYTAVTLTMDSVDGSEKKTATCTGSPSGTQQVKAHQLIPSDILTLFDPFDHKTKQNKNKQFIPTVCIPSSLGEEVW